jgi:two-component system, sensor histidine kinase YesM
VVRVPVWGARSFRLSLNARLVLILFVFMLMPFGILGAFWYRQSMRIIVENVVRYNTQTLEQITGRLDLYLLDLDRRSLLFVDNHLVNEFLAMESTDPYDEFRMKSRVRDEVLLDFVFGRFDIHNASVVSVGRKVVSSASERNGLEGYDLYVDSKRDSGEDVDSGKIRIIGARWVGSIPILTMVRRIRDSYTYETTGALVLDINYRSLYQILEQVELGNTGFLMLVDSTGTIVYHPDQSLWGQSTERLSRPVLAGSESGHLIASGTDGKREIVMYDHLAEIGWSLIAVVPLREAVSDLVTLLTVSIAVAGLLFVVVIGASAAFTMSLTRPLSHLRALMAKAKAGDLSVRAPRRRSDELGDLFESFNTMVAEIGRLTAELTVTELREKELQIRQSQSELLAMQSQINPHFLYNTLEVVNSYAIEAGVESVSTMVAAIAKMFRYNAGGRSGLVPIREEIEHISLYLRFQKERYRDLAVEIEIDDSLLDEVRSVCFVLQPIVENAFVHGYEEHGRRPEYLGIHSACIDGRCVLRVSDHGGGMSRDRMDEMNRLFHEITVAQLVREGAVPEGIDHALWNVHSRIRLAFGDGYGLSIGNSSTEGTTIEVTLPMEAPDV